MDRQLPNNIVVLSTGGESCTVPHLNWPTFHAIIKGALYRICFGVNRLGDSGVEVV